MEIQKLLLTTAVVTAAITTLATAEIDMCSQHYFDRQSVMTCQDVNDRADETDIAVVDIKQQFLDAISTELSVLKEDSSFLRSVIAENTVLGPDVFAKVSWTKSF